MRHFIIFFFIISVFCLNTFAQEGNSSGTKSIVSEPATVTYKRKPKTETNTGQQQGVSSKTQPPSVNENKPTQNTNAETRTDKLDTIVKLGGKRILCTVQKISMTTIDYILPSQTIQLEIPRKEVERVIFRSGRKEFINKPIFSMIDQSQWQSVVVTDKAEDVEGLYKKEFIKSNAASGSRSPKAAKLSATIRLQKKAANLGCLMVLITNSEMKGGYGEVPGWDLEGIAYTDTPPADTASVNKAIQKMIERSRARTEKKKKKD